MTGHKIITIGREFGSGGHEIGQKLADRLGIPLYDDRLVSMAAEELGVKTEDAERVDDVPWGAHLHHLGEHVLIAHHIGVHPRRNPGAVRAVVRHQADQRRLHQPLFL